MADPEHHMPTCLGDSATNTDEAIEESCCPICTKLHGMLNLLLDR
jgi:hypothetical protein